MGDSQDPCYDFDREFITGFSLDDAEAVEPIKITPWCGETLALDPFQQTRKGWAEKTSHPYYFRALSKDLNREYGEARHEDQPYLRVLEVETPDHNAYVFEFPDVRRDSAAAGWFDDVVSSLKCAILLGVPVQPHVVGDGWWAIKSFDKEIVEDERDYLKSFRKDGDQEEDPADYELDLDVVRKRALWDAARLTIVGQPIIGPDSWVFSPDGEYRYASFECSGHSIQPYLFRYIQNVKYAMGKVQCRRSCWYDEYEDAIIDLAEFLSESDLLTPYASNVIIENINRVPEAFPISGKYAGDSQNRLDDFDRGIYSDTSEVEEIIELLDRRANTE